MYRVIHFFTDLQDNDFAYNVGDEFPHAGRTVTQARLDELSGTVNKQGVPLIELVPETPADIPDETPVDIPDEAPKDEAPAEEKQKKKKGKE